MIELCRRHDRWSRFETVRPEGPTAFADGTFDLVYAFSVFPHFAEDVHVSARRSPCRHHAAARLHRV